MTQSLTLTESRAKLLPSATATTLIGLAMLSGARLFFSGSGPVVIVFIIWIGAGSLILLAAVELTRRVFWPGRMEIGESGLRLHRWKAAVRWSDLEPFRVVHRRHAYDWYNGVGRTVYSEAGPGTALVEWRVRPGISPPSFFSLTGWIPRSYPIAPEDLCSLLEEWRTRWFEADPRCAP